MKLDCNRIERKLTDFKYLNIIEIKDPQNNVNGYQYAQRKGIDSIAFICYDSKTKQYLLNTEYKPPVNEFVTGAFGGSMDKDITKDEIVINEVREEAGFEVEEKDLSYVGKVLVSTQMNQWCHLYLVNVNREKQLERHPENKIEAMATTKWVEVLDILGLEDWKPMAIMSKASSFIPMLDKDI